MDRLYVACAITSVCGIAALYILSSTFEPPQLEISEVTKVMVGDTVTVSGILESHNYHKDGHLFMTISDGTGSMRVTVFSDLAARIDPDDVLDGSSVRVTGSVDEYRGRLQVIPRSGNGVSFEGG